MPLQTAVVIGATGLIGSHVVDELLADENFSAVTVLVRKDYPIKHPKLTVLQVDFNNTVDYKNKLGTGQVIFSCIGTTQTQVNGDRELYRKIDFDIPVTAAKLAKKAGFTAFLVVSAIGSNAKSSNFYLRLKGEVDEAVSSFGINSVHIFRPSMLLGNRKQNRPVERVMQVVMRGLSFAFIGSLKKYKAIQAKDVAKAMVAASKAGRPGDHVYTYDEMMALAEGK